MATDKELWNSFGYPKAFRVNQTQALILMDKAREDERNRRGDKEKIIKRLFEIGAPFLYHENEWEELRKKVTNGDE